MREVKCRGFECQWYHNCNPLGSRASCGWRGHKEWVWCDNVTNCQWFECKNDAASRLDRLEGAVYGKELLEK